MKIRITLDISINESDAGEEPLDSLVEPGNPDPHPRAELDGRRTGLQPNPRAR